MKKVLLVIAMIVLTSCSTTIGNKKLADSIMEKTQASSYKEIGLTSFEYYVKMENFQNE